jgi:hypothetical protein
MKTLIGAIALVLAAPVAAQTAPAGDIHGTHAQTQKPGQPAEHKMDCCKEGKQMECCEKAKQQGQKANCCSEHGQHAEHGGHGSK